MFQKNQKMTEAASDPQDAMPSRDCDGTKIEPTEEGNKALQKGAEIYNKSGRARSFSFEPPNRSLLLAAEKPKIVKWFGLFYKRLLSDPRMMVLFDASHADTNVSAAEHGKRLALALLSRWTGDPEYYSLKGRDNLFQNLHAAHDRAQACPMRSTRLRGDGFTTRQRDSWLGHLWLAREECGDDIPLELRDGVVHHLAAAIGIYGPFVKASEDEA